MKGFFIAVIILIFVYLYASRRSLVDYGHVFHPTSRPDKFTSHGDGLFIGEFRRAGFTLMLKCKINSPTVTLVSFGDEKLVISDNKMKYKTGEHTLERSPYESFRWMDVVIYTSDDLTVMIDGSPFLFRDSLPDKFELTVGGVDFSGAVADVRVNGAPLYRDISAETDPGLFQTGTERPAGRDVAPPPVFVLAADLEFSLDVTVRVFRDGVYFSLVDGKGELVVGRRPGRPFDEPGVNLAELEVSVFDTLTFTTSVARPTEMRVRNDTTGRSVVATLPRRLGGRYDLRPGKIATCFVTRLGHRDRTVWSTDGATPKLDFAAETAVDLAGTTIVMRDLPVRCPWTCGMTFEHRPGGDTLLFSLRAEDTCVALTLRGKSLIVRRSSGRHVASSALPAPREFSAQLNRLTVSYDRYLTLTLAQADAESTLNIFSPELQKAFTAGVAKMGPANVRIHHLEICSTPFRSLPRKTATRSTVTATDCLVGVIVPYYRDVELLKVRTDKSVAVFIKDGDVYLHYGDTQTLIDRGLVRMDGYYRFLIRMGKRVFDLSIVNPEDAAASYRFNPGLNRTDSVTVTLPDKPYVKARLLGGIL